MALQYITVPDCRHAELRRGVDFIQKHIFPGSLLLSVGRVNEALNRTGDLFLHHLEDLGASYARTLHTWWENFNARSSPPCARSASTNDSSANGITISNIAKRPSPAGTSASCRPSIRVRITAVCTPHSETRDCLMIRKPIVNVSEGERFAAGIIGAGCWPRAMRPLRPWRLFGAACLFYRAFTGNCKGYEMLGVSTCKLERK